MKAASEQSEGHSQWTAPLLAVKEAAVYLHMSVSWVNQTLKKLCPARKIGGRVKYLKDDLDRFIRAKRNLPSGNTHEQVARCNRGKGWENPSA